MSEILTPEQLSRAPRPCVWCADLHACGPFWKLRAGGAAFCGDFAPGLVADAETVDRLKRRADELADELTEANAAFRRAVLGQRDLRYLLEQRVPVDADELTEARRAVLQARRRVDDLSKQSAKARAEYVRLDAWDRLCKLRPADLAGLREARAAWREAGLALEEVLAEDFPGSRRAPAQRQFDAAANALRQTAAELIAFYPALAGAGDTETLLDLRLPE